MISTTHAGTINHFRFLLVYLSTTQLIGNVIYRIWWLYLFRYLFCHSEIIFFFNFFHSPCADASSPGRMLKAFFISRCQSAYPFPDSRPDCSWTNSPLTVLLPPPFSYSVQTEVRVGWRWRASSRCPEVAGAPGDQLEELISEICADFWQQTQQTL